MSIEISGVGKNVNVPSVTGASSGTPADFSSILQKSSKKYGIDLDALFEAASAKYKVPVNLLKAVAKTESEFNPKATSPCGAMGIMQLMPGTAAYLGVTNAYDPEQNIMGGAKYLSQLLSRFDGNTKLAAAGYNAGPDAVVKYNGVPPYAETQNYVVKVLGYLGVNITAGTVPVSSGTSAGSAADLGVSQLTGTTDTGDLSSILENSLMSGSFNGDMSSMLASLSGSDPNDVSSKLMATVYQLQLEMLKTGSGDDENSVIV